VPTCWGVCFFALLFNADFGLRLDFAVASSRNSEFFRAVRFSSRAVAGAAGVADAFWQAVILGGVE